MVLLPQPGLQFIEQRFALFLTHGKSDFSAFTVNVALDVKKRIDAFDRFQRRRRDRYARWDGRVVAVQPLGCKHMSFDEIKERLDGGLT